MNALLIVNPGSGQGKAAREKRKLLDLVSNMPHIHPELTENSEQVTNLARDAAVKGYDRVIVAGGDGTINNVINGLNDTSIPLGIIPLGTANVLAYELGIPPNDIENALDIIHKDKIQDIDLGIANGRRFLLMAGLGFDAEVVDLVSPKVKDILGTVAYAPPVLQQLICYNPVKFRLTFENNSTYETDAFAVIISNCGCYAKSFRLAPQAIFDDGLLDILIFESSPGAKLKLIGQTLECFFQQRILDSNATYFKATQIRIESNPPVKMQLDGDVYGKSNVDIKILPKALRLIVP